MSDADDYEHYNYDPPVPGGAGTKGRTKRETSDKQQSYESKQHGTKDARKAEQQITNAETKQKEKMKKQNNKE